MRILTIGDIVGKPGQRVVQRFCRDLRSHLNVDLVVANAENSADGSGLTPHIYESLTNAGVDCITLGDHIYRRKEIYHILETEKNIVKPANYPKEAPGKEFAIVNAKGGTKVAVISLLGRVFMKPVDCPWAAVDRVLDQIPADVKLRIVDFHAEATSDKQVMGRYLDGRVTAVVGTHTHVATADAQVLPRGTAFQCDLGMTGPHESILGRKIDAVTETTVTGRPTQFHVATGDVRLNGALIEADEQTGKAQHIKRFVITEDEMNDLLSH